MHFSTYFRLLSRDIYKKFKWDNSTECQCFVNMKDFLSVSFTKVFPDININGKKMIILKFFKSICFELFYVMTILTICLENLPG